MSEVSRKCIVSNETFNKDELLRFVEIDGQIIPDLAKKLPGRGVYVTNSSNMLKKAIEKKLFSKALKKNVGENISLHEMVVNIVRNQGLSSVNIARKAGVLITGFEKVKNLIISGKAAFILEANDAGDDGHNRIVLLAKGLEVFTMYNIEELDKALNRVNTVHVAFKKSEMSNKVYKDFSKIRDFLGKWGKCYNEWDKQQINIIG